jgi:thiamine-phosphate pyrophosphorylase
MPVPDADPRTGPSAQGQDASRWRRERLGRSRLYVVTDARQDRGDLEDFLETILEAGTDVIQLREKDAEGGDLLRWGEVFLAAARRHGALFVVNDRPDVAVALGADGVHLGQGDLPPTVTRRLVGPAMIIGLSTHSEEQLRGASPQADYVCVGPVNETTTKPGRPAVGLDLVRLASTHEQRAWFAIGGINRETVGPVRSAGARRVAVVRAVTDAPDPAKAVRELLERLSEDPT